MSHDDNEVGYKKPPKSGQFKKGQSGNPNGRPKNSKNLKTLIRKEIGAPIIIQENNRRLELTKLEALAKSIVSGALRLEPRAIKALLPILSEIATEEEVQEANKNTGITSESDLKILQRFLEGIEESQTEE